MIKLYLSLQRSHATTLESWEQWFLQGFAAAFTLGSSIRCFLLTFSNTDIDIENSLTNYTYYPLIHNFWWCYTQPWVPCVFCIFPLGSHIFCLYFIGSIIYVVSNCSFQFIVINDLILMCQNCTFYFVQKFWKNSSFASIYKINVFVLNYWG